MRGKGQFVCLFLMFSFCSFIPHLAHAAQFQRVNARSAIVYDMASGKVLYEQNADALIPPASLTKILTLYLTWEAIDSGQISLSDRVRVSTYAASMPNVRMGLKAGDIVTVAQLIRGMAVESGNDAAVAMAEYLGGNVRNFVAKMNAKARQLGMTHSRFMTPNGLPARGQLTTARDILKLSIAYLRRFPASLAISSLRSYTYHGKTDHNPNNLLGRCPGVDGLKTGFVCASGFNISATAIRDHTRIIAVVLGARTPGIRCVDAEHLIEDAYREIGGPYYAVGRGYPQALNAPTCTVAHRGRRHRELRARWARRRRELRARRARRRRELRARRARLRRLRLAGLAGASHAHRRRVEKARGRYAARARRSRGRSIRARVTERHARSLGRSGRIRSRRAAVRERKAAARRRRIHSRRDMRSHRIAKRAVRRKTLRARSTKASLKSRRARRHRAKLVAHRRTRVKAAIKRRRNGARRARDENRRMSWFSSGSFLAGTT